MTDVLTNMFYNVARETKLETSVMCAIIIDKDLSSNDKITKLTEALLKFKISKPKFLEDEKANEMKKTLSNRFGNTNDDEGTIKLATQIVMEEINKQNGLKTEISNVIRNCDVTDDEKVKIISRLLI